MPKVHDNNFKYINVTPFGGKAERKKTTGRNIYDLISWTDLNRSPIETLQSHILRGTTLLPEDETPFMSPKELSETLLVDGSMVLYGDGVDYDLLEDTIVYTKWLATQVLKMNGRQSIVRVFEIVSPEEGQERINWSIRTYSGFNLNKKYTKKKMAKYISSLPDDQIVDGESYIVPFEAIYIWENGRGILFYNQKMFLSLEGLEHSIDDQTKSDNTKTIISGYQGSSEQLKREFKEAGKLLQIPGEGVKVIELADSGMVAVLTDRFYKKKKDFLETCRVIHMADAFNMAGLARRLLMTHMLHHIDEIQEMMVEIYADFGMTMSFDQSVLMDIDEKFKELEFLDKQRERGNIDDAEYEKRSRKLL